MMLFFFQASTNANQNPGFNVVHPVQTINIDGQEAIYIPPTITNLSSQFLPGGQVVRPNVLQTIQLPNGSYLYVMIYKLMNIKLMIYVTFDMCN